MDSSQFHSLGAMFVGCVMQPPPLLPRPSQPGFCGRRVYMQIKPRLSPGSRLRTQLCNNRGLVRTSVFDDTAFETIFQSLIDRKIFHYERYINRVVTSANVQNKDYSCCFILEIIIREKKKRRSLLFSSICSIQQVHEIFHSRLNANTIER